MLPRFVGIAPIARGGAVVLLALFLAALVNAQPPKEPDKKDPDKKEPTKEIEWPKEINGRDLNAWLNEVNDPDPVIREYAIRTIPNFGPPAQEDKIAKVLLKHFVDEKDPGVKLALFDSIGLLQFKNESLNQDALRILIIAVDNPVGPSAGVYRLHAIQTIAMFGAKGEGAITALTGNAVRDPSYETRRNIARTLGLVGFNETTGPNMKALTRLADTLSFDPSASVRMESLQALMRLGPPWAGVKKKDDKTSPPINTKDAAVIIKYMRQRVGDPKATPKPTPPLEKDKQVEIWARLVLMRFDPKEVNDENLDALAKYLTGAEPAVKVQALNAMLIMGPLASKKLDDVLRVMDEPKAPYQQVMACVQVLAAMGGNAKPALPKLKALLEVKKKELSTTELELAKKKDDPKLTAEKYVLADMVKTIEEVIKHIDKSKPLSPSELGNANADDPKKDPKKP